MTYKRNTEIRPGLSLPDGMQRVALGLSYDGSAFYGFQRQKSSSNTIQHALEQGLTAIAKESITLVCAGRTDAGVHATGQVVHFDTLASRPDKAWVMGVNAKLPDTIRVQWAKAVPEHFHSRFSAGSRTYRFVYHSNPIRPSILRDYVTHTPYSLNYDAMVEASKLLVGEHDFDALRSSRCQAPNSVRTIEYIRWYRQGGLMVMEIRANAFLHHMVRNIAGSLMMVGRGKESIEWLASVLASRDRTLAGETAPPGGLYLVDVQYAPEFALPRQPLGPSFLDF